MARIFCDSFVRFLAKPNFTTFPRNSHQHQHLRHFYSCCCCQCVLLLINDGHCSLQEAATAAVPGFCNPRLSRLTTRGSFPGRVRLFSEKKSGPENSPRTAEKSFHFSVQPLSFIFGVFGGSSC